MSHSRIPPVTPSGVGLATLVVGVSRQDPPKHRQLRQLVSQAFTPRAIEAMAPRIQAIAEELCDQADKRGSMEVLEDFANPLPVYIIAELLGVPRQDRERFRQWSDALVGNNSELYFQCQREMSIYFSGIANERRIEPRDDLISNLVHAKVEGEGLSELEIIGFCILLLVAGNETTTNWISAALLCLADQREVREELIADPDLIPKAMEEVLRYVSPVQMLLRWVKEDTEFHGYRLKRGKWSIYGSFLEIMMNKYLMSLNDFRSTVLPSPISDSVMASTFVWERVWLA